MIVPEKYLTEALGLSRSTLRTRRARGRLQRRGSKSLHTALLGPREHALVSVVEASAPPRPSYRVECGVGLTHIHNGYRIKRATLAERREYALRVAGNELWCPCERCLAERKAWSESAFASARAASERDDGEDELGSRRERVL